jgi:carboxylate-amine ligase
MPARVTSQSPTPDAATLRARFDAVEPFTVGLEEEALLLEPETLALAPVADALLARLGEQRRFAPELPAAQLELRTAPSARVPDALAQLARARADLLAAGDELALPAAVGVHPFAPAAGTLRDGERAARLARAYGPIARRQLVASLQVHVAVGGAERTLAVYDALRGFLPELAALAANAAFYEGRDSGLASVRPLVCTLLPRQGIPPALDSCEQLAAELRWGARAGALADAGTWWWELRPHPRFGTLELRVPDAQSTLADAGAIAAVAQALVAWLAERADAGELPPAVPAWRIAENRWAALRHGLDGTLADLQDGEPVPARERLATLLDALAPVAARLGAAAPFAHAFALVRRNGAIRQRAVAADVGVRGLARWHARRFADPLPHGGDAERVSLRP